MNVITFMVVPTAPVSFVVKVVLKSCTGIELPMGIAAWVMGQRDLRRINPSAVYEIRPVSLYLPGVAFPRTEAAAND